MGCTFCSFNYRTMKTEQNNNALSKQQHYYLLKFDINRLHAYTHEREHNRVLRTCWTLSVTESSVELENPRCQLLAGNLRTRRCWNPGGDIPRLAPRAIPIIVSYVRETSATLRAMPCLSSCS